MTTYSPKIDPFNRWLVRPVTKAMVFFLAGLILNYIILCLWDAYAWSTEISSTYGLLIIRAIVVIILAIVDLIALPSRATEEFCPIVIAGRISKKKIKQIFELSWNENLNCILKYKDGDG